jgi:hypothetical protein
MRPPRPSRPSAPAGVLDAALLAGALLAALGAAPDAGAQVLGLPVVQSPFAGRPFAVALDGGTGSDGVRVGGLAITAHRPTGRLVASLGVGRVRGFEAPRTTYGGRLAYALRLGESGAIGVAPFVGYGRVSGGDTSRVLSGGDPRQAGSLGVLPAGVGLGYRRSVAGRPVVLHVTPQAQWWRRRATRGAASEATWYGRAAAGADVAVTPQIGLSLGYEGGGSTADVTAGPRRGVLGLALSYAPRRRER